MRLRSKLGPFLSPLLRGHPRLRTQFERAYSYFDVARHSAASIFPEVIQPDPREVYITLTANCNLRCMGCRYGRDFMPGQQLAWPLVRDVLDDMKELAIRNVRLYGGEPLLHKDLERIVAHSVNLGLSTWLTTNGILLREKLDGLHRAGLRRISLGFYGTGDAYNAYVQRKDRFKQLEEGVAYLRDRYGTEIHVTLGWVLMRPTCNPDAIRTMWKFAEKYSTPVGISLIHYSLPYFTEGPDHQLQFRSQDRPAIEQAVAELLRLKTIKPHLIQQSEMALRSIPDWLIEGPNMRVPCDRYRLIWIGADGTVQLCYVTFKLGNLHEKRLRDLLFTAAHTQAARDAFALRCPNCHCSYPQRIEMHAPSRRKYA
jgi:molybdenum cofactor biosynthesis enzyme MoaA